MCQNPMKLSIIIPVYNAEKYIEKCIKSVLCQTYQCLEVIVVNDGSSDKSLYICNKLRTQDCRVIIVSQQNSGSAKARRVGIDHAKGDYIMFLDADDYLCSKSALETVLATIEKTSADLIQFSYKKKLRFISKKCRCVDRPLLQGHCDFMNNHYPMLLGSYYGGSRLTASLYDKVYKHSLFTGIVSSESTPHIFMGDDVYLNIHILCNVQKACFIPDCLYTYQCLTGGTKRFNSHYMEDYAIVKDAQLKYIRQLEPQYNWKQDMEYYCHAETAWCMYAYCIDIVRAYDREHAIEMIEKCLAYPWIRRAVDYFTHSEITDTYAPTLERISLLVGNDPTAYYESAIRNKEKKDLKYYARKFL